MDAFASPITPPGRPAARTSDSAQVWAEHVPARRPAVRVLVIPGLRDSGEAHWQTWLQAQYRDAVRVVQHDWHAPDLDRWSQRIAETIGRYSAQTHWVAVAHSFGTLALAHHLAAQTTPDGAHGSSPIGRSQGRVVAALMAAPADPLKFDIASQLPAHALGVPLTVIGSETDPWMPLSSARDWAHRWGGGFVNLGDVGHINTESGFGPWPLARHKVDQIIRRHLGLQSCLCQVADDSHFS